MDLACPRRKESIARHREENPRLSVLEDQQHRRHGEYRAERDYFRNARHPGRLQRECEWIRSRSKLLVGDYAGQDVADDDVDHRADRQATQYANREIALRVLRLFRSRRDGVETDVGEEHYRCALMDARKAVRRERVVICRIDVLQTHDDEQRQDDQLDRYYDVIGTRAFSHPE